MDPLNIPAQFEIRSFSRSGDNMGYLKNVGSPWIRGTPTLPFLQNVSWAIIRMDTVIVLAKFEVRSFARSRDNSD